MNYKTKIKLNYYVVIFLPDAFLPFLRDYTSKYQLKSIDSNDFKAALINYFTNVGKNKEIEEIDWNAWLYSPGMPPVIPR